MKKVKLFLSLMAICTLITLPIVVTTSCANSSNKDEHLQTPPSKPEITPPVIPSPPPAPEQNNHGQKLVEEAIKSACLNEKIYQFFINIRINNQNQNWKSFFSPSFFNEANLNNYFVLNFDNQNQKVNSSLDYLKPNNEKLIIAYLFSYGNKTDPNYYEQKHEFEITGFKQNTNQPDSTIQNLINALFHVDFKINKPINNELVKDFWSQSKINEFFFINKDQLIKQFNLSLTSGFQNLEPNENDLTIGFLNVSLFANSTNDFIKFQIEVSGFKDPFSYGSLDEKPSPNISLPVGAVSYKKKIPIINTPDTAGSNGFNDLVKKFIWDQYVKEMMYQARFLLYQQYGDNFSEINYFTTKNHEDYVLNIKAVGIIDKPSTYQHTLQFTDDLAGNSNILTKSYQKGDIIEFNFNSRWSGTSITSGEPDWKPTSNAAISRFSFTNNPANINNTKINVYQLNLSKWKFSWTVNKKDIYQNNSLVFRTFSFTINRKPK